MDSPDKLSSGPERDGGERRYVPEIRERPYGEWFVMVAPDDRKGCGALALKTESDAQRVAAIYTAWGYKAARDLTEQLRPEGEWCA